MSQILELASAAVPPMVERTLTYADGTLLYRGLPHRVIAGSMHYFRVHPAQWADRIDRLADLGVNTVDSYIAWNFHERTEGSPRFDGWRDLERFVELAADAGLDVIVRPGPYICAEWDNGGLPSWLTGRPGVRLRSTDPLYFDAVEKWFDALIPRLAVLQASNGGPIVAVQVENEFGSFGNDTEYLIRLRDALLERGISELLYTADGPTEHMQRGGAVDGVLATATFGSKPAEAAQLLRERRPTEPFMCAEFWNGWFDHWGERHHVRQAEDAVAVTSDILDTGGSLSLYMAHGGTNFGLWAGANHDGTALQPCISSYDSDAPIAENGELTVKYFALRRRLWPHACGEGMPFASVPETLAPRAVSVERRAGLLDSLRRAGDCVPAQSPLSFERLGQGSGMVLYRAQPVLSRGENVVAFTEVHDRAIVFVNGERVGVIDAVDGQMLLPGTGTAVRLEVLVENQGRINYGPLLGQGKGILGDVRVGGDVVRGWEMVALPIDEWSRPVLDRIGASAPGSGETGFATATLDIDTPADAFLALPGFGKGFVWVGDFLLGRYWKIGPQQTLYIPAPLLHEGRNLITVLELDHFGHRLEVRNCAELGPSENYIEILD